MPKLAPVTDAELAAAVGSLEDAAIDIRDIADRIEKGYSKLSGDNGETISSLATVARTSLQLLHALHIKERMTRLNWSGERAVNQS